MTESESLRLKRCSFYTDAVVTAILSKGGIGIEDLSGDRGFSDRSVRRLFQDLGASNALLRMEDGGFMPGLLIVDRIGALVASDPFAILQPLYLVRDSIGETLGERYPLWTLMSESIEMLKSRIEQLSADGALDVAKNQEEQRKAVDQMWRDSVIPDEKS